MNYEIIKDEKLLRDFIDWLPNLGASEQYYLCLFARSKYCKDISHIKSDKSQLKRFTSTKERMFDKIRQLECPIGSYKQYKEGKQETIDMPQESLALYITPNPRDLWKATFNTMIKIANCIRDTNTLVNPQAEAMSEIQKSKGKTRLVHFDFDCGDRIDIAKMAVSTCISNQEALTWVKTRGGVHLLIDPSKIEKGNNNKWYQEIKKVEDVDQSGDMMLPVVGCTQGNFIPHFINN